MLLPSFQLSVIVRYEIAISIFQRSQDPTLARALTQRLVQAVEVTMIGWF